MATCVYLPALVPGSALRNGGGGGEVFFFCLARYTSSSLLRAMEALFFDLIGCLHTTVVRLLHQLRRLLCCCIPRLRCCWHIICLCVVQKVREVRRGVSSGDRGHRHPPRQWHGGDRQVGWHEGTAASSLVAICVAKMSLRATLCLKLFAAAC